MAYGYPKPPRPGSLAPLWILLGCLVLAGAILAIGLTVLRHRANTSDPSGGSSSSTYTATASCVYSQYNGESTGFQVGITNDDHQAHSYDVAVAAIDGTQQLDTQHVYFDSIAPGTQSSQHSYFRNTRPPHQWDCRVVQVVPDPAGN